MGSTKQAPEQVLSRFGVGGSQAAAIIGVHPYSGPINVFQDAFGMGEPFEGNEATYWGNRLEGPVRGRFAADHDVAIHVPPESLHCDPLQNLMISASDVEQSPTAWRRATPDGIVVDHNGIWQYGLEVKTAGIRSAHRWGESGTQVFPIEYRIQCLWYMNVTGLRRWDIAVLIGGQEYREYSIIRTAKVEHEIRQLDDDVAAWYERHIIGEVAPPPDASEAYARYLATQHPAPVTGEIIDADPVVTGSISALCEIKQDMKLLASQKVGHENIIAAAIGDDLGVRSDLGTIKWSERKGSVKWKAVAEELYDAHCENIGTDTPLASFADANRGKPSRTLSTPRNWGK